MISMFMSLYVRVFVGVMLNRCVNGDGHYETPNVTLLSCLCNTLVLDINPCHDDGLMYIRTDTGIYNIQPTADGHINYTCSFDVCDIQWGVTFVFGIQRKTYIQTNHDLKQTFLCVPDLQPINPRNDTIQDGLEGDVYRFLYTASVVMRFYDNGTELVSGSYVKLGTQVSMVIDVANNIHDSEFFDINIKSCTASVIQLLEDRCPIDAYLFGMFEKTGTGVVENMFSMFRPTSTSDEPVNIYFTCTVEVCMEQCTEYYCNGTEPIAMETVRRKRSADKVTKSMSVGTMFSVGLDDPVIVEVEEIVWCILPGIFISITAVLGFLLLLSMSTMMYYIYEYNSPGSEQTSNKHQDTTTQDGAESARKQNIDDLTEINAKALPDLRSKPQRASSFSNQLHCDRSSEMHKSGIIKTAPLLNVGKTKYESHCQQNYTNSQTENQTVDKTIFTQADINIDINKGEGVNVCKDGSFVKQDGADLIKGIVNHDPKGVNAVSTTEVKQKSMPLHNGKGIIDQKASITGKSPISSDGLTKMKFAQTIEQLKQHKQMNPVQSSNPISGSEINNSSSYKTPTDTFTTTGNEVKLVSILKKPKAVVSARTEESGDKQHDDPMIAKFHTMGYCRRRSSLMKTDSLKIAPE